MNYVDGFVLAVPKKKINKYLALARKASRIWKDHGALEYREAVGDDLAVKMGCPFPKNAALVNRCWRFPVSEPRARHAGARGNWQYRGYWPGGGGR